ncbi:MAG: tRNA-dihydrouridine synthase family protein [Kiritimatiellae bacterium]|nr:tRNA-dihydrouridine synthase family protein [Kiritimatiellia bacterium]
MNSKRRDLWLAPLRGVTIRAFRLVFADAIRKAGFRGGIAPFIPANAGFRYSRKLFADILPEVQPPGIELIPQVIGKDPMALREWCKAVKDLGYGKADLNAGCPFPMIRKKGRGSGLIRSADLLDKMLEAGCDEMGPGNFSLKTRLGIDSSDELYGWLPVVNRYPLSFLTIHARTAVQMYEGAPDREAFEAIKSLVKTPVMYNGDAEVSEPGSDPLMVGRSFICSLADLPDAKDLFMRYVETSREELCGDASVLGRMKELLSYWCKEPSWRGMWQSVKICRTIEELFMVLGI